MTDEMEWNPKNVELPGSIISNDEVSTERFIQKVRSDRYNDLHIDCMQY